MTFLYWKNCILLKVTSDITLSPIKEVCEQTAELLLTITNMVISGIISRWGLKKIISCGHICCQFFPFIFQLAFKMYVKIFSNIFGLLQSLLKI